MLALLFTPCKLSPKSVPRSKKSPAARGIFGGIFDVAGKQKRIGELEEKMSEPSFWDDQKAAQKVIGESNQCKAAIEDITKFKPLVDDLNAMVELVEEADEEEGAEYMTEIEKSTKALYSQIDDLEIGSFLTGPMDGNSAILSVQAGAGGTERSHGHRVCQPGGAGCRAGQEW